MDNMEERKRFGIMDLIILALSIVLCAGSKTFFRACAMAEDHVMSCHWAEQALFGLGIILIVQSVLLLLVRNTDMKRGMSLMMIPTALFAFMIPGRLISLCMMSDMRCNAVMKPAASVFGILIAAAALINLFVNRSKK